MDSDRTKRWGIAAALGAAFAASACCTLPLVLAAVGVGGAFASSLAVLEPYRGVFVALAVGALGFAFWRGSKATPSDDESGEGGPDCACDTPQRSRARWPVLAGAAVVTAVLLAAPTLLSMTATQPGGASVQPVSLASEREAVVRIEGMTCAACARGIEASLARTEGVVSVTVTMEPPEARIGYDDAVTSADALAEAMEALGYRAEVVPAGISPR